VTEQPATPGVARAVLVTGTVGSGKTTVVDAIGDVLRRRRVPNAVIDLDWLRARRRRAHLVPAPRG
jgi:Ni2+-binding GTPase involved in maturation of urease and hydrogenase